MRKAWEVYTMQEEEEDQDWALLVLTKSGIEFGIPVPLSRRLVQRSLRSLRLILPPHLADAFIPTHWHWQ